MTEVGFRVDDSVKPALDRLIKRGVGATTRVGLRNAAEHAALPKVKLLAPRFTEAYLAAGATTRKVYITTRGTKLYDRAIGWLNWGGTITTPIYPRKKRALTVGDGVVGAVTTPRTTRARHFIERGIDEALPQMETAVLDELLAAFGHTEV